MPCLCFQGKYRTEPSEDEIRKSKGKDLDLDVYMLIGSALRAGLRLSDLEDMGFVMLINILDPMMPKPKPKYRKATQEDIDMIT